MPRLELEVRVGTFSPTVKSQIYDFSSVDKKCGMIVIGKSSLSFEVNDEQAELPAFDLTAHIAAVFFSNHRENYARPHLLVGIESIEQFAKIQNVTKSTYRLREGFDYEAKLAVFDAEFFNPQGEKIAFLKGIVFDLFYEEDFQFSLPQVRTNQKVYVDVERKTQMVTQLLQLSDRDRYAAVEQIVTSAIQQVLQSDVKDITANFTNLGMDSLTTMSLRNKIMKEFGDGDGTAFSMSRFLRLPNLKELVDYVFREVLSHNEPKIHNAGSVKIAK